MKSPVVKYMKILLILFLVYGLIVLLSYVFQDKMVFLPTQLQAQYDFTFEEPYEEIFLGEGSEKVHGIFFPKQNKSRGLILYFHGNADDLQRWGKYAPDFTRLGFEIMMIDYPGYGKSGGTPSEAAFYKSAELAYAWAVRRYAPTDIIIYGRSIGCGPASYLATQQEGQKLMLETPFYSMRDVVSRRFPAMFPYPLKNRFPVFEHLQNRKIEQAYIFQGTEDEIVPYASAIKLKPFLPDTSHFVTIEGGKHKNLAEFSDYQEALRAFLLED